MARTIREIALEIKREWTKGFNKTIWDAYMEPLLSLETKDDYYYYDSAESVVLYALANMTQFKGEAARRLKRELKDAVGIK